VQTFVPYDIHIQTARALDRQRLGKQRVECKQILLALVGDSTGWVNHPATKMWRGSERFLADYAMTMCSEWRSRGYVDNLGPWFMEVTSRFTLSAMQRPSWWRNHDVHDSHKAQLLRKNREHYQAAFGLTESQVEALLNAHEGYIWPV
jgi:hypothetical protein